MLWVGRFLGLSWNGLVPRIKSGKLQDGAINEKSIAGVDGDFDLSLVLHTSFGLDHFPVQCTL
jgi:hypothetical protein